MKRTPMHTYVHQFRSGNQAEISFRLPKPEKPSTFDLAWLRHPTWADVSEYRNDWRKVILADVTALDGRTDHRMEDGEQEISGQPARAITA